MVVVRAYLTPQGDRVVDLQDGPNVYRAAPVVDGVGGAQSFLSLPVVDGSSTGTGSLAVVAFTQGLAPRPVVLGFLPASQSRAGFTSEAQAAQGVPAFASLQAGELRVAGGRVGVGENGAPFVERKGVSSPAFA
jgi:hypothetical protein